MSNGYEGPEYYKKGLTPHSERLESDLYNTIEDLLEYSTIDHALHALNQALDMVKHCHERGRDD